MVSEQAISTHDQEEIEGQLATADSYLASRLVSQAEELFQLILVNTEEPRAIMGVARCMYLRRRLHEALSHLQQLASVDPDYPELANNMGVILFEMGLMEQARQQFERAAQETPGNTVTWLNLMDLARKADDREGCERYCRRLLEVDPGNIEALDYLAGANAPL